MRLYVFHRVKTITCNFFPSYVLRVTCYLYSDELGSIAALNAHIAAVETVVAFFEGVDCWRINYLVKQLVSRAKNSLGKEVLRNIESGSLLKQFPRVSPYLAILTSGLKELIALNFLLSCKEFVCLNEVSSFSPFLQRCKF